MFKFYERTNSDRDSDYYCLFLSGVNYSDLFESDTFLLTYSNGNINDIITIQYLSNRYLSTLFNERWR